MGAGHEENWERLVAFARQDMKKYGVPGVAVGVLHQGETRTAGLGVTNVDHPLEVTDETLFQIGSITKTFTGTAIMRLVEAGKMDLDATVRTLVPDFKVADETAAFQATLRHLLTHTSGWAGDVFRDTGAGADAMAKYVADMADVEQLAPIGTVWSYNNAGFYLAGYLVEIVTGKSYEETMQELVFEPLGLKRCFFNPGDVMTHRFAVGHEGGEEGPQVARPWPLPRAAYAVGGIACDVKDLLRYASFHMGDGRTEDGTQLLTPESIAKMQSTHATVWGDETWGLTWGLDVAGSKRLVRHGGGTVGQVSRLTLVPESNFAVAVFTNAEAGGFVTEQVTKWALREYLGLEKADPESIEASEEDLAQFVGRYSRPMADVELGMLAGRLIAQMVYKAGFPSQDTPPPPPPPPASLALCEKDRLIILDGMMKGDTGDILRKGDGSIGWLRAGGRIYVRQE